MKIKSQLHAILIIAVFTLNCMIEAPYNDENTVTSTTEISNKVTINFKIGEIGNPNIYAIWVEDSVSNFIQNLFVCKRLREGGNLTGTALPYWSFNKYPISLKSEVDGVTSETIKNQDFTVSDTLKDNSIRKFTLNFETDHSFDGNDWFSDQPAILYSVKVNLDSNISSYELVPVGWTPNENTDNIISNTPKGKLQYDMRYITNHKNGSTFGSLDENRSTLMVKKISIDINKSPEPIPLAQTIIFNSLAEKIYGDAPFNLSATASSGLAVSYTSSDTSVAKISGKTVTIVGVGTTTITASQSGNSNYAAANNVLQTLTVNKKLLQITGSFSVYDKEFDNTHTAKIKNDNLSLLGVINDDDLTLNYTAEFSKADVGNDIPVYMISCYVLGNDFVNYTLSMQNLPSTKASITSPSKPKITPIITWATPANIIYGTPLSSSQLNATSGGVSGQFTYSPWVGAILNAGTNHILSVTFTPDNTEEYYSETKTVKITVTKATPAISWDKPANITYGTTLDTAQLNASAGNVKGTFSYTPATGTKLNADSNQSLKVDFTPDNTSNYNTASKTVQINVSKADPVITWENPADIIEGTILGNTQLSAIANIEGTFNYNPPAGTIMPAGSNQELIVSFIPNDIDNYTGTTKTVTIDVKNSSSVQNSGIDEGIFYPNPVSGRLYFTNPEQILKYKLFSVTGALVIEEFNGYKPIEFFDLSPGLYFISVSFENGNKVYRIIKD